MFDAQQAAQHRRALPIQVFRHQISGIIPAADLLDAEIFVFLLQPMARCSHVFEGSTTASISQTSCCCCCVCPDSHMILVSQLTYRVGQSRLHSRPCFGTLIRRCSATILSVLTTRLPECVVRCAKRPPDVERRVLVNQAASASESPSLVTVLSSSCSGNSHTASGAWSKYRPIRFKRVRLGRTRCQDRPPRGLPALLSRRDWLSAQKGPVLRGRVARWAWRGPGLDCGRAARRPSSATASSACRGRCRVHVPTWLSAQAGGVLYATMFVRPRDNQMARRGNTKHELHPKGRRATNCGDGLNKNCETADSQTFKKSPRPAELVHGSSTLLAKRSGHHILRR